MKLIYTYNQNTISERQIIIDMLSNLPVWGRGVEHRRAWLVVAGIPQGYAQNLDLNGPPGPSASIVITTCEREIGYLEDNNHHTLLGLVIYRLYCDVVTLNGKSQCAKIIIRCRLTKDRQLIEHFLKQYPTITQYCSL